MLSCLFFRFYEKGGHESRVFLKENLDFFKTQRRHRSFSKKSGHESRVYLPQNEEGAFWLISLL